jgi:hypothetical protein
MRIVRGAMLKGASLGGIFAELAARLGIRLIVSTLAISRYCVTLDRLLRYATATKTSKSCATALVSPA